MDLSLGEPVGEKSSSGRQFMKGDPPPPRKTKGHGSAPQPPSPRGLLLPVNESFKELKRPSLPQRSGVVGTGWEPTNYYPPLWKPSTFMALLAPLLGPWSQLEPQRSKGRPV